MIGWDEEEGRGLADFHAEQDRAEEDAARAAESAAADMEAQEQEHQEATRCLVEGDRVELVSEHGPALQINLGTLEKITRSGYHCVRWDDGTTGQFSPGRAVSLLRLARGEDALPRHRWVFDIDCNVEEWSGPIPTADEPVCYICREQQTDDNEFGPCFKAAEKKASAA